MKRILVALGLGILVLCGLLAVTGSLEPFLEDLRSVVEFFQTGGAVVREEFLRPLFADDTPKADGLPSDEEMEGNFYEHWGEFEHLAQLYREDRSIRIEYGHLVPTPEIAAMMTRMRVCFIRGDSELWEIPNAGVDRTLAAADPHLYEKMSSGVPEVRRFVGVRFRYAHRAARRIKYGQPVWKEYYFIPVELKVKEGVLRLPGPLCDPLPYPTVVQTLNEYPTNFATWDCALRKIATHWHIRMCQEK